MDEEGAVDVYRPLQFDGSLPEEPVEEENVSRESALPSCEGEDMQQLMGSPAHEDLVGGASLDDEPRDVEMVGPEALEAEEEGDDLESSQSGGGKRKRGKKGAKAQLKPQGKKNAEEDVCFICFDGGELVLCDRRFCPKAYHPTCINRDDAFFQKKGRWNCGWHLCSICRKAAHFMCYTCTYSLCKRCIKEADFFCVRSNKGLCSNCMRLVTLIEDKDARTEPVEVDFDDKSSWEYLYKEYWLDVKHKLSLTSAEITHASNPYKESEAPAHDVASSDDDLDNDNNDMNYSPHNSSGDLELGKSAPKRQMKRRKASTAEEMISNMQQDMPIDGLSESNNSQEWASKELLDLVEHMGGGKSVLSLFEVQSLLMDYVTKYKLRDPRKKSQIICDARLQNLFGRTRLGHFEMLKLIESHILVKETSSLAAENEAQGRITDDGTAEVEVEGNAAAKTGSEKKRKIKRKPEESTPPNNTNDYAAIDVHNISLVYLRRNLVEDLLDDLETFKDKIVGSFVRIRIPGSVNKQDMYRLVQVVGTSRASEAYKTSKKSTDLMLEVLNLNKTETVTIDSISNQEFSEEECKRLRQSIKYGFISRLTVGEIQEKAKKLQHVKVNDWFETELLRLSHLRDRASEKGRRKELRECVEKIQVLSDPDERARRLQEVPEVHADPNMDPNYESDEKEDELEDRKKENFSRPRDTGYFRRASDAISPRKVAAGDALEGLRKSSNSPWERNKSSSTWGEPRKEKCQNSINDNAGSQRKSSYSHYGDQASEMTNNALWNQTSDSPPGTLPENRPLPQMASLIASTGVSETDKVWHYCDPSGRIQGPFSMVQLRKWSRTGYFPADLRIWRMTEKQEGSILLTDALAGKFQKEPSPMEQKGSYAAAANWSTNQDWGRPGNNIVIRTDNGPNDGNRKYISGSAEVMRNDGRQNQSTVWASSSMETLELKKGHTGSSSHDWGSSKVSNTFSSERLGHGPGPGPSLSYGMPFQQSKESQDGISATFSHAWNPSTPSKVQTGSCNTSHVYGKHLDSSAASLQSTEGGLKVHITNIPSEEWTRSTLLASPTPAESQSGMHGGEGDWSDLPTPTPKSAGGGWLNEQSSEAKTVGAPQVFVQPMSPVNSLEQRFAASAQPAVTLAARNELRPTSGTPTVSGWDSAPSMMAPTQVGVVGNLKNAGIVSSGSAFEPPADVCDGKSLYSLSADKGLVDQTLHNSRDNGSSNAFSWMGGEYTEKAQADSGEDTSLVVDAHMVKPDSSKNMTGSSASPAALVMPTRNDLAGEHVEGGASKSLPKSVVGRDSLLADQDLAGGQFSSVGDLTPKDGVAYDLVTDELGQRGSQPVSELLLKAALAEKVQNAAVSPSNSGLHSLADSSKKVWYGASLSVSVKGSPENDVSVHGGSGKSASVSDAYPKSAVCQESQASEIVHQVISGTSITKRVEGSSPVSNSVALSRGPDSKGERATNLVSHSFPVYDQDVGVSSVSTNAAGSASLASGAKGAHDVPATCRNPVSSERQDSAIDGWRNIPSKVQNFEGLGTLTGDFSAPATATAPVAPSGNWGMPTNRSSGNNSMLPPAALAENASSWVAHTGENNTKSIASEGWAVTSRNNWGQPPVDTSWSGQTEPSAPRGSGWGPPIESAKVGWSPEPGNTNARRGMEPVNQRGEWEQRRQDSNRLPSHGDGGGYGGQSYGGRSWSRPSGGGSSGGLGPRLPRAQKVCKFHENGYCKKGASCDFLHP
ncbi:zinc finger CCCH domain-containing protein 19-like [Nymphaea colorata]|nr:zinc finger CCCH domain-containing protein 19-like [Nymphaea colorata]